MANFIGLFDVPADFVGGASSNSKKLTLYVGSNNTALLTSDDVPTTLNALMGVGESGDVGITHWSLDNSDEVPALSPMDAVSAFGDIDRAKLYAWADTNEVDIVIYHKTPDVDYQYHRPFTA
ncbi:hypothetical protein [Vibrio campbellii]|uniref:hypothetical protein n=1 Tax=Vibrio campbellii TaxID=680 RepID=UPI00249A456D|nr:hypothetical protein [Vibrio campbellii]